MSSDCPLILWAEVTQNEIVTCSGGRSTGSIKVIRSGADFSEKAMVQGLCNVTHIWPLKEMYCAS
jgi:DNA damage-binding protein 1